MGLRIGHYGPKFAALFVRDPQPWMLFVQHLVIGWLSAIPLLVILRCASATRRPVITGAVYGAAYYVAVNFLALPIYFGDLTPWQVGLSTIYPSLIGHIIFGTSIGWTSSHFASKRGAKHVDVG